MERQARCRICKELIKYVDPKELGYHLIVHHPNANPIYFTSADSSYESSRNDGKKYNLRVSKKKKPDNIDPSLEKFATKPVPKPHIKPENYENLSISGSKKKINLEESFYSAVGNVDYSLKDGIKNKIKSILSPKVRLDSFTSINDKENKTQKSYLLPRIFESSIFEKTPSCQKKEVCAKSSTSKCKLKVCRPENCPNITKLCEKPKLIPPKSDCKACYKETCPNITKKRDSNITCKDSISTIRQSRSKERKKIKVYNKPCDKDQLARKSSCTNRFLKRKLSMECPRRNISKEKGCSPCSKILIFKRKTQFKNQKMEGLCPPYKMYKTMVTSLSPGKDVILCPHCERCSKYWFFFI